MGIEPKKTESRLKVNMGHHATNDNPTSIDKPAEPSFKLKKEPSGQGLLKKSKGLKGNHGIDNRLPTPAPYPWHALSPTKSESLETEDIEIEASNARGKPQKFDWISVVFQPLGALLAIVVILILLSVTGSGMSMGLYMLIGGITGVLGIVWGVLRYRSQTKQAEEDKIENEKKYRNYLQDKESEIKTSVETQLRVMSKEAPSVDECVKIDERSTVLWCRSFNSVNFMSLRMGCGSTDFLRKIVVPEKRYAEENDLTEEARSLAKKYEKIEHAPICCNLRKSTSLGIIGDREAIIDQTLSLIVEAAALHSYEDLKIVLLYPSIEAGLWRPARFLPHVYDNDREQRYIAENKEQADALLKSIGKIVEKRQAAQNEYGFSSETVSYPHYLVIVADLSYLVGNSFGKMLCTGDESLEVSCIFLANRMSQLPQQCKMIAEVNGKKSELYDKAQYNEALNYSPETITVEQWEKFNSTIAPIRLENPTVMKGIPRAISFFEAYGIKTPEDLDLKQLWNRGHPESSMEVKLGAGQGGEIVGFDIHPNRCGTHGIFVGGTSSGKTTMVRAWVLSMAASFPPERVTFVLVDFKEPGLLTGLKALPHVVGTIGKLDVDIDRNLTALKSEISRRQKVFDAAESINIYDYLEKHYSGEVTAKEPMPFLYIVVDELNEFKMWSRDGAGSDWMSLLNQLYQTGSALGIHIIAGSQTPGPFSPVMFSNARFRWCLRTNEPADSKTILGNADAFDIKAKGRAFICVGRDIEEIQPMYADNTYYTPEELQGIPERDMALVSITGERTTIKKKKGARPSELEILVDRIAKFAETNGYLIPGKIWPDRLPDELTLDELPEPEANMLSAIVGLIDNPSIQKQYPLEINMPKTGGFLVYGAGQTGKTTFLQSFVVSLLDNNNPEILEVYIVESAAGDFEGFDAYPHVNKICDSYSASDVIKAVEGILKKRLAAKKDKDAKNIVLIVDNLNGIMAENKAEILNIVQNGPGRGIYLVASATQASGASSIMSVESLVKTGFSFWISQNAYDYRGPIHCLEIKALPPTEIPGRGITSVGKAVSFQTAMLVPRLEHDQLPRIVQERAIHRWGVVSRSTHHYEEASEEGTAIIGQSKNKETIIHNFKSNSSLLVISDDYDLKQSVLKSLAEQLMKTTGDGVFIGVDLDQDSWGDCSRLKMLVSGEELDQYLEDMRNALIERKTNTESVYPPFVFFFENLKESLKKCSLASRNRIDKNLLLNASKFSVFFIAACSFEDYDQLFSEEEETIAQSSGNGKEIVPLTRASVGKCLLLDSEEHRIHSFFHARYSFDGDGSYYLGAGKAVKLATVSTKGGD